MINYNEVPVVLLQSTYDLLGIAFAVNDGQIIGYFKEV